MGSTGTRTIATNWAYVDVEWLNKIKADSQGNVHLEAWAQPHGERTVLTKPKILTVPPAGCASTRRAGARATCCRRPTTRGSSTRCGGELGARGSARPRGG